MAQPELWQQKPLEPDAQAQTSIRNLMGRLGMREQALLYLAWLGLAELVVSIWEPWAGMVMHGAILMTLLIQATLFSRGLWQKFLVALALAPLIRLLSLTMPLPEFPFVYWYFVVGAPLFIAAFLVMHFGELTAPMVGLTARKPAWQVLVGLTGLGLGLLEYLILRPDPLVAEMQWRYLWLPALILLVFTGFLEELIFRGVMQYTALGSLGRFGMIYVALVFVVLHIGYRSFLDLIFVLIVALFYAYVTHRTGSILGVSVSHGLINVGLFLIFPFLLAKPVEQLPIPQDIMAPRPALSATAIIIPTRTATATPTPSTTPTLVTPTKSYTPTASKTAIPPTKTPLPTLTVTPTVCSPPAGWRLYRVQYGDSWRKVARRYGMTTESLMQANCLDNGTAIFIGQQIYVPYRINLPTALPTKPPKQKVRKTDIVVPSPTQVESRPGPVPPTATPPPPTPVPTTAAAPTPIPPTATPPAPTLPPTATAVPNTEVPPTPVPPTATMPAATLPPPTSTPPIPTQEPPASATPGS